MAAGERDRVGVAGGLAVREDDAAAVAGDRLGVLRDGVDGDEQDVALADHGGGRGTGFGRHGLRFLLGWVTVDGGG